MKLNNNVLFYVLFLQIGAHDPLQTNKPKQTSTSECARTHAVMSQQDSLKRWDFKDDLKDMNVFDDLTLQGKQFQTDSAAYMKKISDQVNACRKWEDKEWKYQRRA